MRLRGFYKEERDVATMDKLSRLDDYLLEYCSYGCAYFVLENKEPHRASFDKKSPVKKAQSEEREPKSVRAIANKRSFPKTRTRQGTTSEKLEKTRPSAETKKTTKTDNKRHFVIRQKRSKKE